MAWISSASARSHARERVSSWVSTPDLPFLLFPADPARPAKRADRAFALAEAAGVRLLTLGGVDPDRVPLWVNAASAVVVPSEREGFGLAVLEALACDVPVLATPVGVHAEALDGVEGALCAPFEVPLWLSALAAPPARGGPARAGARPRRALLRADDGRACARRVGAGAAALRRARRIAWIGCGSHIRHDAWRDPLAGARFGRAAASRRRLAAVVAEHGARGRNARRERRGPRPGAPGATGAAAPGATGAAASGGAGAAAPGAAGAAASGAAQAPAAEGAPPGAAAPAEPAQKGAGFRSRGRMRRRARFLRKARELAYRDLGGLVFNLHRFGQRNDALVLAKLNLIGQMDSELRTLEAALRRTAPDHRAARGGHHGMREMRGYPQQRRPLLPQLRPGDGPPRGPAGRWHAGSGSGHGRHRRPARRGPAARPAPASREPRPAAPPSRTAPRQAAPTGPPTQVLPGPAGPARGRSPSPPSFDATQAFPRAPEESPRAEPAPARGGDTAPPAGEDTEITAAFAGPVSAASPPTLVAGTTAPGPVPIAPAGDACPLCGAPLRPDQDWCLRCGAAARTRLAATPNWKAPAIALALLVALSLGVLAASLVSLAGSSSGPPVARTVVVTTAQATPTAPAPTTPAPTAPSTTPGASAPGASTPTTPTGSSTTGAGAGSPVAPSGAAPRAPGAAGGVRPLRSRCCAGCAN